MITIKDATVKYSQGGIEKASLSIGKMLVLSFMAGMFIALAGSASTFASAVIDNPSLAKIITSLVFPAGLAMVIVSGSELFTGNNLMIISVLDKRINILSMLKNWVIVYIGNILGSFFVTGLFSLGHVYSLFDNAAAKSVINIAVTKSSIGFSDAFIRGILCNILVCVAVMMALTAENTAGKIAALYLPIFVFVMCGFEHSVANMSYISGGLFANMEYGSMGIDVSELTWYNFFVTNLLPVTIGNIAGGCLTGILYHITARDK